MSAHRKAWTPEQQAKSDELVRRGKVRHLMNSLQRTFYDMIQSKYPANRDFFIFSSRKVGKSYTLGLLAIEHCLAKPNQLVRHIFPTMKLSKETMFTIMSEILPLIPEDVRPVLRRSEGAWYFKNGSQYRLGGADPQSMDNNRGPFCTMLLGDEMCFWDANIYQELLKSTLLPQMSLVDNPIRIYASTPPQNINHPSITDTIPAIKNAGCFMKATIYENPMLTPEKIQKIIEDVGGVHTNAFRREYMAELIVDNKLLVCPEFNLETHITNCLPPTRNEFDHKQVYVGYRAGDFGVGEKDLTGILGAIYDHNEQVVYITQERLIYKPVIDTFKLQWDDVEENLEECVELVSTLDAFEQLKVTLRRQEGLDFKNPRKGKVTDQITYVRQLFESNKIKVHSSCTNLIEQLSKGIWKENGKEFSRSETLGHLDLLACLVYLVRSIEWKRRPLENRVNFTLGGQVNVKVNPGNVRNTKSNANIGRTNRRL